MHAHKTLWMSNDKHYTRLFKVIPIMALVTTKHRKKVA